MKNQGAFLAHLGFFLFATLILFAANLLLSPGSSWSFWLALVWGCAVVVHALSVYGGTARAGNLRSSRTFVRGSAAQPAPAAAAHPESLPPPAADIATVEARIARLWRTARQIPVEAVRERAFRVCAAADRVAEALAADRADPELVAWFSDRYLTPAETILEQYVRLAQRGIASAEPALTKVETEDLPLLESRLDALYERLHRGDVIELSVASEMLDLDLADQPPRPPRTPPS